MLKTLTYIYHKFKNPNSVDYVDEGLGIAARFSRCKKFWQKHLDFTKFVQQQAAEGLTNPFIAVLGAGRLLDVNLDLLKDASEISLYDADPSCLSVWKRKLIFNKANKNFYVNDLTEVLDLWSAKLEIFLQENKPNDTKLISFLNSLSAPELTLQAQYDLIISVNLLSQIIVIWRDIATSLLEDFAWAKTNERGQFKDPINIALENSKRKLEIQHLNMLNQSKAKRIALIYDTHFFAYEQNHPIWDVENAVISSPEVSLSNFKLAFRDSWLWHLAPQGIEYQDYGLIHQVVAYAFKT